MIIKVKTDDQYFTVVITDVLYNKSFTNELKCDHSNVVEQYFPVGMLNKLYKVFYTF